MNELDAREHLEIQYARIQTFKRIYRHFEAVELLLIYIFLCLFSGKHLLQASTNDPPDEYHSSKVLFFASKSLLNAIELYHIQ
jgi:hypothetical protein